MQRREAVALLKEILTSCGNSLTVSFISLQKTNRIKNFKAEGYELQIKIRTDKVSRKTLRALVERRNLEMEETNGLIVVYTPRREKVLSLASPLP